MPAQRKLFVALEGLPGAGKTTIAQALASALQLWGVRATWIEEHSRNFLLPRRSEQLSQELHDTRSIPRLRVLHQWVSLLTKYALAKHLVGSHDVVIMDQSWLTTYVLDKAGHKIPDIVINWFQEGVLRTEADVTIYLRITLEKAQERDPDAPLLRKIKLMRRVAMTYQRLSEERGWETVDAMQDIDAVVMDCVKIILRHYRIPNGSEFQPCNLIPLLVI